MLLIELHNALSITKYDQYRDFNYTQKFVSGVSLVCQADIDNN
jgi:hypothetical protein